MGKQLIRMTRSEKIQALKFGLDCLEAARECRVIRRKGLADELQSEALNAFKEVTQVAEAELQPGWTSDPRNKFGVR